MAVQYIFHCLLNVIASIEILPKQTTTTTAAAAAAAKAKDWKLVKF